MAYILMHKNIETAVLDLDAEGRIVNAAVINSGKDHMPPGAEDRRGLTDWWKNRAIPDTREYIRRQANKGEVSDGLQIQKRNRALSLSDCYWIRKESDPSRWEDVSLFKNEFVDDHALIHMDGRRGDTYCNLAPGSSEGELEKFWTISEQGVRRMVKGNYSVRIQQSLNEIFACRLLDTIGWKAGSLRPGRTESGLCR